MTPLKPETLAELRRPHSAAKAAFANYRGRTIIGPLKEEVELARQATYRLPALLDAADERDQLADRVRELEAQLLQKTQQLESSVRAHNGELDRLVAATMRAERAESELTALRATTSDELAAAYRALSFCGSALAMVAVSTGGVCDFPDDFRGAIAKAAEFVKGEG